MKEKEPIPEWIREQNRQQAKQKRIALRLLRMGVRPKHVCETTGLSPGIVSKVRSSNGVATKPKASSYFIYGLACPRNGQLFYVGFSADPWRRFYNHLKHPESAWLASWLCILGETDDVPHLRILCKSFTDNPHKLESWWIMRMIKQGHPLVNREITDW